MYFAPSLSACAITPGLLFSPPAIFWRRAFRLLRYFGNAPFTFCVILATRLSASAIFWRRHLRYFGDVPFAICDILATCLFASCVCDILAMRLFAFCDILATRLSLPAIFWRRAFRHLRYLTTKTKTKTMRIQDKKKDNTTRDKRQDKNQQDTTRHNKTQQDTTRYIQQDTRSSFDSDKNLVHHMAAWVERRYYYGRCFGGERQ
jgi:hypothetical protein